MRRVVVPAPPPPRMAGQVHSRSVSPVPARGAAPANSAVAFRIQPANPNTAAGTAARGAHTASKPGGVPSSSSRPGVVASASRTNANGHAAAAATATGLRGSGGGAASSRQGSLQPRGALPLVRPELVLRMDAAVRAEQELLDRCEQCVPETEAQLERAIEQRDVELAAADAAHEARKRALGDALTAVTRELAATAHQLDLLLHDENMVDEKITMTCHQITATQDDCSKQLEQRERNLRTTLETKRRILEEERAAEAAVLDAERAATVNTYGLSEEGAAYVRAEAAAKNAAADATAESLSLELRRRELFSLYQELKGTIRVYCRVKGVRNADELEEVNRFLAFPDKEEGKTLEITQTRDNATSTGRRDTQTAFNYDKCFGIGATQTQIFEEVGPLVDCAVDGYKVCMCAYGQTGSGKTYTMEGDAQSGSPGLIPRAIDRVFERAAALHDDGWTYTVKCSFLEIYNEQIRNLLETSPAYHRAFFETSSGLGGSSGGGAGGAAGGRVTHEIMHHGRSDTTVTNINEIVVKNPAQVHKLLAIAAGNRSTAQTRMNDRSSRSHCVFTMRIEGESTKIRTTSSGILCLVDLAGSERVNESGATGQQLKEAININRSLMHLGECINSMSNRSSVVSWRNSKLTHLLQNFLSGDGAKMLMLVAVSNKEEHVQETLNSLRFAAKVNVTQIGHAKPRVQQPRGA